MSFTSFVYGIVATVMLYAALRLTEAWIKRTRKEQNFNRPMPVAGRVEEEKAKVKIAVEKEAVAKMSNKEKAEHVTTKLDRFKK